MLFYFFQNFTLGLKRGIIGFLLPRRTCLLLSRSANSIRGWTAGCFWFCLRQTGPEMAEANSKKGKNRQTIQYGSLSMIRRVRWTHFRSQIQPNFFCWKLHHKQRLWHRSRHGLLQDWSAETKWHSFRKLGSHWTQRSIFMSIALLANQRNR